MAMDIARTGYLVPSCLSPPGALAWQQSYGREAIPQQRKIDLGTAEACQT